MTTPITPDPAVHTRVPGELAAASTPYGSSSALQALQNLPTVLLLDVVNAILRALGATPQEITSWDDMIVNLEKGVSSVPNGLSNLFQWLDTMFGIKANGATSAAPEPTTLWQWVVDTFLLPLEAWLTPGGAVSLLRAELLVNPGFTGPNSIQKNDIWTWDPDVYFISSEGQTAPPGSAKVTADGNDYALLSNSAQVNPNTVISAKIEVLATGLIGTGTPIQLWIQPNVGDAVMLEATLPSAAPENWIGVPEGSVAATLAGIYKIPDGVDSVTMRLVVTSDATGGTIHFDGANEFVGGLWAAVQGLFDAFWAFLLGQGSWGDVVDAWDLLMALLESDNPTFLQWLTQVMELLLGPWTSTAFADAVAVLINTYLQALDTIGEDGQISDAAQTAITNAWNTAFTAAGELSTSAFWQWFLYGLRLTFDTTRLIITFFDWLIGTATYAQLQTAWNRFVTDLVDDTAAFWTAILNWTIGAFVIPPGSASTGWPPQPPPPLVVDLASLIANLWAYNGGDEAVTAAMLNDGWSAVYADSQQLSDAAFWGWFLQGAKISVDTAILFHYFWQWLFAGAADKAADLALVQSQWQKLLGDISANSLSFWESLLGWLVKPWTSSQFVTDLSQLLVDYSAFNMGETSVTEATLSAQWNTVMGDANTLPSGAFWRWILNGLKFLHDAGDLIAIFFNTLTGEATTAQLTAAWDTVVADLQVSPAPSTAALMTGIINTYVFPTATVAPQETVQQMIDGLSQAVTGSTATGNAINTWLTNLENWMDTLFGIPTKGTTLTPAVVPNIKAGNGSGQSSDLQTTIDGIYQAITGVEQALNPASSVKLSMLQIPSLSGSGFSAANTSSVSMNASSTPSIPPSYFYGASPVLITPDLTWSPTRCTLTVSIPGWYLVNMSFTLGAQLSGGYYMACALFQNGVNTMLGPSLAVYSGFSFDLVTAAPFIVYAAAGSTIAPGLWCSGSLNQAAFGGDQTYFQVALMNKANPAA